MPMLIPTDNGHGYGDFHVEKRYGLDEKISSGFVIDGCFHFSYLTRDKFRFVLGMIFFLHIYRIEKSTRCTYCIGCSVNGDLGL